MKDTDPPRPQCEPPRTSWWCGLSREELSAAAKREAARMNAVKVSYNKPQSRKVDE